MVLIDYLVNGNSKSNQFRISRKCYCFNYIGATTSTDKKYTVDFSIIVWRELSLSSSKLHQKRTGYKSDRQSWTGYKSDRQPDIKVIGKVGTSAMRNARTKQKSEAKKLGREKFEVLLTRRCWLYKKQNLSSDFFVTNYTKKSLLLTEKLY